METEIMEIAQWLTTIVLSGIASVLLWDRLANWKKRQLHFSKQFVARRDIYDIMHNVTKTTNCKRFLILKTTNGGGKPKIGGKIYASVIYEETYKPFNSVVNVYNKIIVDKEYVDMLRKVALDGFVSIDVPEMRPGLLKDIYESEGVALSQIFYLHETDDAFYYCSIATDSDGTFGMTSKSEQLTIRLNIDKLRGIFKKIS